MMNSNQNTLIPKVLLESTIDSRAISPLPDSQNEESDIEDSTPMEDTTGRFK